MSEITQREFDLMKLIAERNVMAENGLKLWDEWMDTPEGTLPPDLIDAIVNLFRPMYVGSA